MLNEPHQKLTSEIWNEFIAEGISLIRKIDDKRTLMIGPANWNSINSLNTLEIPNDENLIVTVHTITVLLSLHIKVQAGSKILIAGWVLRGMQQIHRKN